MVRNLELILFFGCKVKKKNKLLPRKKCFFFYFGVIFTDFVRLHPLAMNIKKHDAYYGTVLFVIGNVSITSCQCATDVFQPRMES